MILKGLNLDTETGDQLWCEGCGYRLDGLGLEGVCPECGRERGLSDPARRTGSAWQRGVSLGAWLRSGLATLRRPRTSWDRVRVDGGSGRSLAMMNAASAAAIGVGIPGVVMRLEVLTGVMLWLLLTGVLWVLTAVERRGLSFWGRVHGGRVTADVAWSVCGHAGAGWVVGGALASAGWVLGGLFTASQWTLFRGVVFVSGPPSLWTFGLGWIVGLLVFETLAYLGVRRMRFANAPGAGALTRTPREGPA